MKLEQHCSSTLHCALNVRVHNVKDQKRAQKRYSSRQPVPETHAQFSKPIMIFTLANLKTGIHSNGKGKLDLTSILVNHLLVYQLYISLLHLLAISSHFTLYDDDSTVLLFDPPEKT